MSASLTTRGKMISQKEGTRSSLVGRPRDASRIGGDGVGIRHFGDPERLVCVVVIPGGINEILLVVIGVGD